MRKFITTIIISLSLIITGSAVYAVNISSTLHDQELVSTLDNVDQYLGRVNTCDSDGTTCSTWAAFKDSDNGRIYLVKSNIVDGDGNMNEDASHIKYYAQKSNDSRWEYMVRIDNKWEYFSL
ncbi:MAG: hypothetical protein H9949_06570 [Candidatus Phocaeicola merdigallinarum]|nr:hypothetical protein [Candidatus Phocaeicola merdigallinarum]